MQTSDLTQGVEYFLCNPVTEVFLVAFRAKIRERQNSNRANPLLPLPATLRRCFRVPETADRVAFSSRETTYRSIKPTSFKIPITQRFETESSAAADLTPDVLADDDLAGIDRGFDSRSRINAIAIKIAVCVYGNIAK